jgi:hypothetical protein
MKFKLIAYVTLFLMITASCVEPYLGTIISNRRIIIIEGILTDVAGQKPIIIKESVPEVSGGASFNFIQNAKVDLFENGKNIATLKEKDGGVYYFPENFKGKIGSSYALNIKTSTGDEFQSADETLFAANEIKNVRSVFDKEAIKDPKGASSAGFNVYLDVIDNPSSKDFFLWDWKLYEKQLTCKTCIGGRFFKNPLPEGNCIEDALLRRYNNIFDYVCESNCWEIINSNRYFPGSNRLFSNGKIENQAIGQIPVYQYTNALLEVNQYAISEKAYEFFTLSKEITKNTGGFADTPPAALIGNVSVKNNPNVVVSGYFIVSAVNKFYYWLDKKEAFNAKVQTVGLLGGRETKYEPAGPDTSRPPLAPCIESENRTKITPKGWQF